MKKTMWLRIGVSILVAAILCLTAWSGVLDGVDGSVSDGTCGTGDDDGEGMVHCCGD